MTRRGQTMNQVGLCGIQGGGVLGLAGEIYQRGIPTKEDLEGTELEWGNVEAFETILNLVVKRQGIGDILAQGVYRAALEIGKMKGLDLTNYVVQEKGMEIGGHGSGSQRIAWTRIEGESEAFSMCRTWPSTRSLTRAALSSSYPHWIAACYFLDLAFINILARTVSRTEELTASAFVTSTGSVK